MCCGKALGQQGFLLAESEHPREEEPLQSGLLCRGRVEDSHKHKGSAAGSAQMSSGSVQPWLVL